MGSDGVDENAAGDGTSAVDEGEEGAGGGEEGESFQGSSSPMDTASQYLERSSFS